MDKKVNCYYDQEKGIFYKKLSGDIYLGDLITSWESIIHAKLFPDHTKQFIIDYREARLRVDPDRVKDIANIYKERNHIFSKAKVALIMQKPEQVIMPILVNEEQCGVEFKPFYTEEAAVEWLNR
ncbi:hypothetical protein C900_03282 [Fulvivirga imtechensis AK7]|uniref:STAS/SEC14 domain-containing protein n=1 Tax=Fulvivirga imtechensis AK7 TaxID=1237149 RepID=L8JU80_9BACT|nr:hypothetical protein [Fulvivirga imtechensis]ELR70847.1 hypothetical protein C900_03282 [Fulvivirga imtechensis AK7]